MSPKQIAIITITVVLSVAINIAWNAYKSRR